MHAYQLGKSLLRQVSASLGIAPGSYHALAIEPSLSLEDVLQRHAIANGIVAYLIALARHRAIPLEMLADMMRVSAPALAALERNPWLACTLPEFALLLGLIALDAPLADLQAIVQAMSDHELIGRQAAVDRATFSPTSHDDSATVGEGRGYPLIESALRHLTLLQRNGPELPGILRHELARAMSDLERFHILLRTLQLEPDT